MRLGGGELGGLALCLCMLHWPTWLVGSSGWLVQVGASDIGSYSATALLDSVLFAHVSLTVTCFGSGSQDRASASLGACPQHPFTRAQ